jgi:hypothetical protein
MVVEDGEKRLAVECDGDRYRSPESLAEDTARQAVLERLGWQFVRIRGSAFYRNPDAALRQVFDRLAELGIAPSEPEEVAEPAVEAAPSKTLIEELEDLRAVPGTKTSAETPSPAPAPKTASKPKRKFGRAP